MALLYIDGFDHYDGNAVNLDLAGYTNRSNITISSTRSRNGGYSLRNSTSTTANIIKPLPTSLQTFGFGCAFWFDAMSSSRELFSFIQSDGSTSTPNSVISIDSAGVISHRRQSYAGPLLGSSAPGVLIAGVWNHIEARVTLSNTVGSCQVRVNGVEVLNLTNVDNVFTGAETCPALRIHVEGSGGSLYTYFDDFYIWDTSGSQNNTFLGDRKVSTLNPSDNTGVSEWSYTGAASPVQCINGTQDGDTSYIYAGSAVPVTSEFELQNVDGTVGLIAGVQLVNVMRKIEAGTVIVQPSLVSGSSATNNGSHSVADNYAYYSSIHETNPATGMPWTASALNSARIRLRRTT